MLQLEGNIATRTYLWQILNIDDIGQKLLKKSSEMINVLEEEIDNILDIHENEAEMFL